MLGLGKYDSDDDGEKNKPTRKENATYIKVLPSPTTLPNKLQSVPISKEVAHRPSTLKLAGENRTVTPLPAYQNGRMDVLMKEEATEGPLGQDYRPLSPDAANSSLVQQLTLPPVPDLGVPLSPPGSPPPKSTKLFAQFLKLKRDGIHFNQRLAKTPSIRNPNLLKKQLEFAGISEEEQHDTAMPHNIVPTGFPVCAYWEELNRIRDSIEKKTEAQQAQAHREAVDFVPALIKSRDEMDPY
ncbi:hypothetical protein EJ05DRAFT_480972 [Pseudovirgaria hyperparasitica]|uniref:HCNGP-domain-containing protein n=1 Tax=Pseudovirgaria hyperparasitica TaxID=470096 RepID=A0A6A6VRJ7_9PEZI|nr:uncharacterized protein EJ05DRAFT_480972 [Pseudovirgaria hyperparasitica]KAF2752823.1 hypothetical protein EJ05DRAFT_480972 [Pseudovirgaria hyperparasitica]